MRGWILDLAADPEQNCIIIWIKGENGSVERYAASFYPSFYLHASPADLAAIEQVLADDPAVHAVAYESKRLWPGEPEKEVLRVLLREYRMLNELAREIDELGEFARYDLYNVDLSIPFAYLREKDVLPMTFIEATNATTSLDLKLLEDTDGLDYSIPRLRSVDLGAEIATEGIPKLDDPLLKLFIGDSTLEGHGEAELLLQLSAEMRTLDPDLVYTEHGDSFLLPYLYYRAQVNELDDFYLGRDRDLMPLGIGKGRSYASYGRIRYKPPQYLLNGRVHIDRAHSFIYREGGIHGLIELSRLSSIPLQPLARVTPGTVITAMQIARALHENVLVRWKKNVPEDFKDAKTLFIADRGGLIYEPIPGVHENAVEIDFTSLYPTIMVKHNISPETVLCACCKNSNHRAPHIGYHICEKRMGLIPRVLESIIARRAEYKKRLKDIGYRESHAIYDARKNALKWILVTCFGYTGYRNARFGRIECHEVINAYGRELLLTTARLAEDLGYKVLHGIVDSLWLKARTDAAPAPSLLRDRIYEETGIALEVKGIYRWIVFLPRKTDRGGALNRYYGLLENGTMKIRGLELRRSDSPQLIKNAQMDMLRVMATANDREELQEVIPAVIEVLKGYTEMVMSGACNLKDLIFTSVVSKELEDYTQFTNNVACLLQLRERGLRVNPGEQIAYVITDAGSRSYAKKVKAWQLAEGDEGYDKRRYVTYLVRAGASILSPFGYTEQKLADILSATHQLTLAR